MAQSRAKLARAAQSAAAIAAADHYRVNWYVGHTLSKTYRPDPWERAFFYVSDYATAEDALTAARAVVVARGKDEYGRGGMIYAVTAGGLAVHVE